MEVSRHVGVTSRARALTMAEEREEEEEAKRRKIDSELSSSLNQQHKNRRPLVIIKPDNIPVSPEIKNSSTTTTTRVFSSDRCSNTTSWEQLTSSRCSSNGILKSADVVDPENEGFRFQNSVAGNRASRREATQSSDLTTEKSESAVMPSSEAANSRRISDEEKMPLETEIEDFFSAAEKEEQKRFTERYNYDIVKDVPLEGRFVWVPVKP